MVVCACCRLGSLFETEDDFDGLFVFDDLGVSEEEIVSIGSLLREVRSRRRHGMLYVPFGEVFGVLVQGVVAAQDVDACQEDLVGRVVEIHAFPCNALVAEPQMYLVENL